MVHTMHEGAYAIRQPKLLLHLLSILTCTVPVLLLTFHLTIMQVPNLKVVMEHITTKYV